MLRFLVLKWIETEQSIALEVFGREDGKEGRSGERGRKGVVAAGGKAPGRRQGP